MAESPQSPIATSPVKFPVKSPIRQPEKAVLSLRSPGNSQTDQQLQVLKNNLRHQLFECLTDISARQNVDLMRISIVCRGSPDPGDSIYAESLEAMTQRLAHSGTPADLDLQRLCDALRHTADSLDRILGGAPGLLQALHQQLTNAEQPKLQADALRCICNVACGSDETCLKLAELVGADLLQLLDVSPGDQVRTTALWTLTNLCASQTSTAARLVHSLGLVAALLRCLRSMEVSTEEVLFEVLTTLNVLVTQQADLLTPAECSAIIETLTEKTHFTAAIPLDIVYRAAVAIQFQCSPEMCVALTRKIVTQLICLYYAGELETCSVAVVYMLRMLSNLFAVNEDSVRLFVKDMRSCELRASVVFGRMSQMDATIGAEVKLVARNLCAHTGLEEVQAYLEEDDLRESFGKSASAGSGCTRSP